MFLGHSEPRMALRTGFKLRGSSWTMCQPVMGLRLRLPSPRAACPAQVRQVTAVGGAAVYPKLHEDTAPSKAGERGRGEPALLPAWSKPCPRGPGSRRLDRPLASPGVQPQGWGGRTGRAALPHNPHRPDPHLRRPRPRAVRGGGRAAPGPGAPRRPRSH